MRQSKMKVMQKGQVVLILILVMTVALAIGLSIVQKSLVDISTASKVEQSSRAFSAAEAGIERALQPGTNCGTDCVVFSENNSKANVTGGSQLVPCIPGQGSCAEAAGAQQAYFELPRLSKEDIANVWLANLDSNSNPPANYYTQGTLDVYWGDGSANASASDRAALEITLVYYSGGQYVPRKWYLDPVSGRNNFETATCAGYTLPGSRYYCFKRLGDGNGPNNSALPLNSMLIRAKLLYETGSQQFAVRGTGSGSSCTGATGNGCYLPPQSKSIISTGIAGETQRRVKLFQNYKSVPSFFDYALFSAGEINK